jgi:peroxiredoxin
MVTGVQTCALPILGAKAPDFSVRDQFGHHQSLAALKGKNGTVLLFFRSADW